MDIRGADDNAIVSIAIKNITDIYPIVEIMTEYWPRNIVDHQIRIHFLDQLQHHQTLTFSMEERYVRAIMKTIYELKSK